MESSRSESDKDRRWILPESMRDSLKEILGKIIAEDELPRELENSKIVVTVGDVVTITLLELGIVPDISIVDYQTRRMQIDEAKERLGKFEQPVIHVRNPAGGITEELWKAIEDGYDDPRKLRIVVDGEEDLASLPCIVLSPSDTTVIYGIPFKGLMVLHVDDRIRTLAEEILKKMEK